MGPEAKEKSQSVEDLEIEIFEFEEQVSPEGDTFGTGHITY